ncbi:carbohydrate ABC transporter permease [Candidatus Sumerlaeota bacterium]|nr:carbohydrate ABC transporter permease [Candidatus Sumerlaeota bacterium]
MLDARYRLLSVTFRGLITIILILGAGTMLLPLLWMLSTSLKTPENIFTFPPKLLPIPLNWQNYLDVWEAVPFARFYLNTVIVAVSVTAGQVATSSLAAYAFARLEFPGRDKVFFAYLATLMIPGAVTMIPVFILLRMIGWLNTYKALILPGMFSAYGTFLLRQFFLGIPTDIEDAARIDGCSAFGIYKNIILPLSKPALATLTIFTFLGAWRDFMWPLIVIDSPQKKTLTIGLAMFQGLHSTDWGLLMAASFLVMIPLILVFLFNQRFFIEGIKLAGLKA